MVRELEKIRFTKNLWERSIGLIGRKNFGSNKGLLLQSCNSIHTFFVRFALDIVFLDKENKILKITSNLKPFSISPIVWSAKSVLELPAGKAAENNLTVDDTIEFN